MSRKKQQDEVDELADGDSWALDEDEVVQAAQVQGLFRDPRYRHLRSFGDMQDDEPEHVGYDRVLTLQAASAIYSIRSAELHASSLGRATWGLFFATVGLVIATIVLVIVTVAA